MGIKTILGLWLCTVTLTAMAAFSSPNGADDSQKALTKAENTMCTALEALNTCQE